MVNPFEEQARLCKQIDEWFDRSRAALLGEVSCSRGCSRPFAITISDVQMLQKGLAELVLDIRMIFNTGQGSKRLRSSVNFPGWRRRLSLMTGAILMSINWPADLPTSPDRRRRNVLAVRISS